MRSFVVVVACALGCSSPPLPPPSMSRACAAPPAFAACSGLAIVTPREPLPYSSAPVAPIFVRGGELESFHPPALLQKFAIDGSPPRFHATSNQLLVPAVDANPPMVTDGKNLFTLIEGASGDAVRAWDDVGAWMGDATVSRAEMGGMLVAFEGLALVASETITVTDFSGVVLTSRKVPSVPIAATAYGCGFAWVSYGAPDTYELTTMPLDGRPQATQPGSYAPEAWPYDPHGLAALSKSPAPTCTTTLDVWFDDGRPSVHRDFSTSCRFVNSPPALVTTSFGVVLLMGDGSFALLDDQGNQVGSPVSLTIEGDEGVVVPVALGDYVAALTTEETFSSSSGPAYVETVIGCAP